MHFKLRVPETLFKHSKLSNYSLKILKFSIFNPLITQTFIKSYHLMSLWTLINISLKLVIGFFLLILISLKFVFSSLRISVYSSQKRNFVVLVYKH